MPLALTIRTGQSVKIGDSTIHLKEKKNSSRNQMVLIVECDPQTKVNRLGYTKEAGAPIEKLIQKEENN